MSHLHLDPVKFFYSETKRFHNIFSNDNNSTIVSCINTLIYTHTHTHTHAHTHTHTHTHTQEAAAAPDPFHLTF